MASQTTIPDQTLVVVATGEEAQLFRNGGEQKHMQLTQVDRLTPVNLEDDGPAGKRPPESSRQETDEATFAKQLAQVLRDRAYAGDFEHLVLIADPITLGQLRPILHSQIADRIILQLDKTLIHASGDEIAEAIRSAM